MEIVVTVSDKIKGLLDKGVKFINPLTVVVGDDVNLDRIAGDGVVIYPGCRLHGAKTAVCANVELGREGPAIVEDCQLGPGVQLKGGYFRQSVFLEKASLGLAAQVREGCIVEEEANGAHAVGLKQTILFPFVTLGSLINFCDCLMAGGVSRKEHSEVGSGYIHFNFTPEGDKTTASLLGDVPRGVMLNQRPIFLGGQGGIVGPIQLGYGNVVGAGSVLRRDVAEDARLVVDAAPYSINRAYQARRYPQLQRIVNNNLLYFANLLALDAWYKQVRRPFFEAQPLGAALYEGALACLESGKKERLKRLRDMAAKVTAGIDATADDIDAQRKRALQQNIGAVADALQRGPGDDAGRDAREAFLAALAAGKHDGYVKTIQSLPPAAAQHGTAWLQALVARVQEDVWRVLPLFRAET